MLTAGTPLGPYEISSLLGKGGMGEVYLAEDTRLGRKVAIKLLPAEAVADEQARKRLLREARAAAALDHPNICAVYEVGEVGGRSFIVMQYLEGETLASRIERQPLALQESLAVAEQVAQALVEAHAHGIVHRDIKPQNIMLTRRGLVKVLDFGLAMVMREQAPAGSDAETLSRLTVCGAIIGTVRYMSPEQVKGEELDGRSDIFSFGTVLYELLSGQQPFAAPSLAETLSAILTRDPWPLAPCTAGIPAELERVARRCLAKEREQRYQHVVELLADLKSCKEEAAAVTRVPSATQKPMPSIAVLPFVDMSEQQDQEYFCDGIAEELINDLSHIQDLRVVARTSAFSFKGRRLDVREIGNKLNVTSVLEGSVRKAGHRLRITAQLVDVANGFHLWSEKFDRETEDIFAIQDEISLAIVEHLKVKLLADEQEQLARRQTTNAEAYQFYLKGRYYWNQRTAAGLKRALEHFQQAVEQDPTYALAYAGLADCHVLLEEYAGIPSSETLPAARAAAKRALQIDDSLGEAHTSLGLINQFSWRFEEAEEEYKRGIELNPNYSMAHHFHSADLYMLGRLDEALAEIKRGQQLDPLSPAINDMAAVYFLNQGDFEAGIEQCQKIIELDLNYPRAHSHLGWAYLKQGREQEALAQLLKGVELSGRASQRLDDLGYGYAALGMRAEAMGVVRELEEKYARRESPALYVAAVYAALGEKDQAFAWLERDFQARTGSLTFIALHPNYDTLRGDPRYTDLLRRMGLRP